MGAVRIYSRVCAISWEAVAGGWTLERVLFKAMGAARIPAMVLSVPAVLPPAVIMR